MGIAIMIVLFVIFVLFELCHCQDDHQKDQEGGKFRTIRDIWTSHSQESRLLDKYIEYADAYDLYFPKPADVASSRTIRLLEIGVQSGGSLLDWKEFYGNNSVIVGVDIDPRCKRSDDPVHNIFVEIGSQMNATFLKEICKRFGPFDIIIDDGGHSDRMVQTSLFTLFPLDECLAKEKGIYAMEDLHTMMFKKYMKSPHEIIHKIVSTAFLALHSRYAPNDFAYSPVFQGKLLQMHLFDSLVIFVKSVNYNGLNRHSVGTDFFLNEETVRNPAGTYYDTRYL